MPKLLNLNSESPESIHSKRDPLIQSAATALNIDLSDGLSAANYALVVDWLNENQASETLADLAFTRVPSDWLLSIVIPVFNEVETIEQVIARVLKIPLRCELVIVDDGSLDGTREQLKVIEQKLNGDNTGQHQIQFVFHQTNQGKGAALRTGFEHVTGNVVVIQDADMEYDPQDFVLLIDPILKDQTDIVYGSRFAAHSNADSPFWHRWGNQLITKLSNLKTGLPLTDVETCYKMMKATAIKSISPSLQERGFGIELEMTAKLSRLPDTRFCQRPIRYQKRTYAEGKKIGWKDGVWAMWCILRY